MFTAKVNNDNRNRINSYWVRKHNRIRNKLQIVSNQSHLNMIEKIQLVQIWKRFDFFQYKMENKGNTNCIFELQEITVALGQKHFSSLCCPPKSPNPQEKTHSHLVQTCLSSFHFHHGAPVKLNLCHNSHLLAFLTYFIYTSSVFPWLCAFTKAPATSLQIRTHVLFLPWWMLLTHGPLDTMKSTRFLLIHFSSFSSHVIFYYS